jgi:hypothetical protein
VYFHAGKISLPQNGYSNSTPSSPSCQPFAMEAHALRAGIPKAAFTPCRQVRKRRLHTRPPFAMEAHALRAGIPASGFYIRSALRYREQHLLRAFNLKRALCIRGCHLPWRHMRSTPASRKRASDSALGSEKSVGIRGRQAMFALIFGFWAHPRCAGSGFPLQFASLRFANSASIPCVWLTPAICHGGTCAPPFAMEAHALRAGIPKAAFAPCRRVRKKRWHTRLEAVFALYFRFEIVSCIRVSRPHVAPVEINPE